MKKLQIALYSKAKEICLQIQEKIDSNEYLIIHDDEIMKYLNYFFTPKFIFDDKELSINFHHDSTVYTEILAPFDDIWEPSFSSIREMKEYFEHSFQFYKISNRRKYNGKKFG